MDKVRAKRIAAEMQGRSVHGWTVGEYLGNGASAVIVTATRESRTAALKLMDPELVERYGEDQQLARIERQCHLIGREHPNLVKIYDGGRCEDSGYLYVSMELVADPALTALVPVFPRDRISPIIHQVAAAAQFLESHGLAHRDIKPDNVAVTRDCERAVLLDLGVMRPIADANRVDAGSGDLFLGTTRYSPPEYLMREEENSEIGWRAVTFYQLGALLHDMIMRKSLFAETNAPLARLIEAVRFSRPVLDAPEVDPRLLSLARYCLEKNWRLRAELVNWDSFSDSRSHMQSGSAKDRIRQRLARAIDTPTTTTIPPRRVPTKRILEDIAGSIANLVRDICLQAGTFPPLEINHKNDNGERLILIRVGQSERHSLSNTLNIVLCVGLMDEDGLLIRVRGFAVLNLAQDAAATQAWLPIHSGEVSSIDLRDNLDGFLHAALDEAQGQNKVGDSALLRLTPPGSGQ